MKKYLTNEKRYAATLYYVKKGGAENRTVGQYSLGFVIAQEAREACGKAWECAKEGTLNRVSVLLGEDDLPVAWTDAEERSPWLYSYDDVKSCNVSLEAEGDWRVKASIDVAGDGSEWIYTGMIDMSPYRMEPDTVLPEFDEVWGDVSTVQDVYSVVEKQGFRFIYDEEYYLDGDNTAYLDSWRIYTADEMDKGKRADKPEKKGSIIMEKTNVEFCGGQSRYSERGVNYMLAHITNAEGEEVELYAEYEPTDAEYAADECAGYDRLREEITAQAKAHGIAPEALEFCYV